MTRMKCFKAIGIGITNRCSALNEYEAQSTMSQYCSERVCVGFPLYGRCSVIARSRQNNTCHARRGGDGAPPVQVWIFRTVDLRYLTAFVGSKIIAVPDPQFELKMNINASERNYETSSSRIRDGWRTFSFTFFSFSAATKAGDAVV